LHPKLQKLKKGKEIKAVFSGRKISSQFFDIYIKSNKEKITRFGVITTKTIGNAVSRNKIRRRVVEILNSISKEINLTGDILIIPKKKALEYKYNDVLNEAKNTVIKGGYHV